MASAEFWDKSATKYAASKIKDMTAYEDTLARTRSFFKSDDHVLEVGCGTGSTAIKLASSVRRYTATDISGKMLTIAENKLGGDGPRNLNFVQSEITKPLADAPFDAICAFSILHLVDDLDQTLLHLRKQLKPGGYLVSKTACLSDMNFLVKPMIKVMQLFRKAPHVLVFTAQELEQAFTKAGFDLIETGHFGNNKTARFIVAYKPN